MANDGNYYRMRRGWMNHPIFRKEAFSRREAWAWLIEEAAFADHDREINGRIVELKRGQLSHSIRFMANAWGWKKGATERFITRLKTETMIETQTGTGWTILTVCNYSKYQDPLSTTGTPSGTPIGTRSGHDRDTIGTDYKDRLSSNRESELYHTEIEPSIERGAKAAPAKTNGKGKSYFWEGRIVRLEEEQYNRWLEAYPNIPDMNAELTKADDYYSDHPPDDGKWFFKVSSWLERAHDDNAPGKPKDPRHDPEYWKDKGQ